MYMMKQKNPFIRPAVLREITLQAEAPVLAGSVVDNTTIVSTGQEVETHDFSGDDFNHQWE